MATCSRAHIVCVFLLVCCKEDLLIFSLNIIIYHTYFIGFDLKIVLMLSSLYD